MHATNIKHVSGAQEGAIATVDGSGPGLLGPLNVSNAALAAHLRAVWSSQQIPLSFSSTSRHPSCLDGPSSVLLTMTEHPHNHETRYVFCPNEPGRNRPYQTQRPPSHFQFDPSEYCSTYRPAPPPVHRAPCEQEQERITEIPATLDIAEQMGYMELGDALVGIPSSPPPEHCHSSQEAVSVYSCAPPDSYDPPTQHVSMSSVPPWPDSSFTEYSMDKPISTGTRRFEEISDTVASMPPDIDASRRMSIASAEYACIYGQSSVVGVYDDDTIMAGD